MHSKRDPEGFGQEPLKSLTERPIPLPQRCAQAGGTNVNTISAVVLHGGRWCRWSADHRHRTIATVLLGAALLLDGGCAGSGSTTSTVPVVVERLVSDRDAPATDTVEVWICDVPADTSDSRYGDLALRRELDPVVVTEQIGDRIAAYFTSISHDQYTVTFVAGGTIAMSATDTAESCVESALDRSSRATTTVLAVATAEHAEGLSGGWGRPGTWFDCAGRCPAGSTRRAAYVGASDFDPGWGPTPPLDLIEHEIGHTLGLPHSGIDPDDGSYLSALDLMSNSAAPRDAQRFRRDAPDTIAVNRLDLGWLTLDDVVIVSSATDFALTPSTGSSGYRLAVIPLDDDRMLTIELLTPTGFDDHLEHAGIAVHVVDHRPGERELRLQDPLGTAPPHLDLLQAGDELIAEGWQISVTALDGSARLAVAPTDG
jgi:hypothetical protein